MNVVDGIFLDGKSAVSVPVTLQVDNSGVVTLLVAGSDSALVTPRPLSELKIDSRLGNLPVRIRWPEGQVFETADHDALDDCLAAHIRHGSFMHRLEKQYTVAGLSIVCVALFVVAVYLWGIPMAGRALAPHVPERFANYLGSEVLDQLDNLVLSPTELSAERQDELLTLFDQLSQTYHGSRDIRLEFRRGGPIAVNALALPGGIVLVTDELVALAENDDQIAAVLLHELGHVEHHHVMRNVVNQTGMAMISVTLFGDVSGLGSVVIALPAIILQTSYSRTNEREADDFSINNMPALDIRTEEFARMFERMTLFSRGCRWVISQYRNGEKPVANDVPPLESPEFKSDMNSCLESAKERSDPRENDENRWFDYISTHPATEERIQRILDSAGQTPE